jgi:hypothetical protein
MDELTIGIKVLAALHAGLITWNCTMCDQDPNLKKQMACNEESPILIWQHQDIGEFYSCPLRWITQPILDWYDEYLYLKEFPGSAPKYGEHNRLFWLSCKVYSGSFNKYQMENIKSKSAGKGDSTSKSLNDLRQGFQRRKK